MTAKCLSRAERIDWLRLINSENVGPATFHALLSRYHTVARAIERLPELSARGGHRGTLRICARERAEAYLQRAEEFGARMLACNEPDYPRLLLHIDASPPVIFVKGELSLLQRSTVAIVGSRDASAVGRTLARRFAAELGHFNITIVSGLARGIDTAAHEASLASGTVAVLAGGIEIVYPPENSALASEIAARGMLISEMMPGTVPQAKHFPRRNRLISGLSLGVLVVEAAERSGSLITARMALEQGREIFAVPGSPLDPRAAGTNRLIRHGAALVTSARDVLEVLEPMGGLPRQKGFAGHDEAAFPLSGAPQASPSEVETNEADRRRVLCLLGPAPTDIDTLLRETGLDPGSLYGVLLELELAGRITRSGRQHIALKTPTDA